MKIGVVRASIGAAWRCSQVAFLRLWDVVCNVAVSESAFFPDGENAAVQEIRTEV